MHCLTGILLLWLYLLQTYNSESKLPFQVPSIVPQIRSKRASGRQTQRNSCGYSCQCFSYNNTLIELSGKPVTSIIGSEERTALSHPMSLSSRCLTRLLLLLLLQHLLFCALHLLSSKVHFRTINLWSFWWMRGRCWWSWPGVTHWMRFPIDSNTTVACCCGEIQSVWTLSPSSSSSITSFISSIWDDLTTSTHIPPVPCQRNVCMADHKVIPFRKQC